MNRSNGTPNGPGYGTYQEKKSDLQHKREEFSGTQGVRQFWGNRRIHSAKRDVDASQQHPGVVATRLAQEGFATEPTIHEAVANIINRRHAEGLLGDQVPVLDPGLVNLDTEPGQSA